MTVQDTAREGPDLRRVVDPPPIYRPIPLWSWNEVLDPDEVRRQVRELAHGGLGGAFMHARTGLLTPYMGAAFMDAVGAALDEARALGLRMCLYDEDRWPSGWAAGAVPLRDESFRVKWLLRVPAGGACPAGDPVSRVARDPDGTSYYRYVSPLGQAWFSGTTYADLMDRRAVHAFIEAAYEPYAARFGEEFGGLIPAIFTDEPAATALPAYAGAPRSLLFWTDELPARFQAMHGYDLLPRLGQLFEDVDDYGATRTDYYRACAWLFERHYSAQVGAWCRARGIALTGHYMFEDPLTASLGWGVSILPHYRHLDWPGVDHIGRQVDEVITGLGCRSVVNQYGKGRMMSELYAGAGQHLSFEDRKWIAEQQVVLGANLLVPHILHYTLAGERKRDYPCDLWYQQPWWPLNNVVDGYLARLCALMSQGEMVPELLVLHPQESLYPLRRPPAPGQDIWDVYHYDDAARIAPVEEGFQLLSRDLLALQRTFDYGDETILAEAAQVDADGPRPLVRVGAMAYPLVVLPSLVSVRATTLSLLEAFAEAGGPILSTGALPTLVDGRADGEEVARLRAFVRQHVRPVVRTVLGARLDALAPPLVAVDVAGPRRWLWQQTRRVGAAHIVFLVNLSRQEPVAGTLHLRAMEGPLARLDLALGTYQLLHDGHGTLPAVPFQLEPGESAVFLAGDSDLRPFEVAPPPRAMDVWRRLDMWEVERLDDNVLPLDRAAFRRGDGAWSEPVPVIAVQRLLNEERYDGPLTLCYHFESDLDGGGRALRLVMERPERAAIRVNGAPVAYTGLAPWRDIRWLPIDIAPHVRQGENVIDIAYDAFAHGDPSSVDDQARRYGTEIEALYLVGDIAVAARDADDLAARRPAGPPASWALVDPPEPTPPWPVRAIWGPFVLQRPHPLVPGDLVDQGLPFYAGRVACRTTLSAPAHHGERVWLAVDRLTVPVVEVRVNGQTAGMLAWRPYQVELTSLLREGANTIELVLYHSLRNLLGPHHDGYGERYRVGPESFVGAGDHWAAHLVEGEQAEGWRASYAVMEYGLMGEARLLRESMPGE